MYCSVNDLEVFYGSILHKGILNRSVINGMKELFFESSGKWDNSSGCRDA